MFTDPIPPNGRLIPFIDFPGEEGREKLRRQGEVALCWLHVEVSTPYVKSVDFQNLWIASSYLQEDLESVLDFGFV